MAGPCTRLALLVAGVLGTACYPDWPPPGGWCAHQSGTDGCEDEEEEAGSSSSSGGPPGTDTDELPTTGSDDSSSTTGAPEDTTGSEETGLPEEVPTVVSVEMKPPALGQNGYIVADVRAIHSTEVSLGIHTGDVLELDPVGGDLFRGKIPVFSSLFNGLHSAAATPSKGGVVGDVVFADYSIFLPTAGGPGVWHTLAVDGQSVSSAALPEGQGAVFFVTVFDQGTPRCFEWHLASDGSFDPQTDFVPVLPDAHCRAIDIAADPVTGAIDLLYEREKTGKLLWQVASAPGFGKGEAVIATGEPGQTALALARQGDRRAVCGKTTTTADDTDAFWAMVHEGLPYEVRTFDHQPEVMMAHKLDDVAHDCVFADDVLVLGGGSFGKHIESEPKREKRLLIEYDVLADTVTPMVGGPGPGTQSRISSLALSDTGQYLAGGHTCADECKPDGEIRYYLPGLDFESQTPLGPLGPLAPEIGEIAWSPAGYVLVVSTFESGGASRLKVEAYLPGEDKPAFTHFPTEAIGAQFGITIAVGPFGEIFAGGICRDTQPAATCIPG